jgi:hypothetical protein
MMPSTFRWKYKGQIIGGSHELGDNGKEGLSGLQNHVFSP